MSIRAQVVGWPPVRSFRKNVLAEKCKAAALVKVSMDGAPYLRKIDVAMYKSYPELSMAFQNMFTSFTIGIYIYTLAIYIFNYICMITRYNKFLFVTVIELIKSTVSTNDIGRYIILSVEDSISYRDDLNH